MIWALALPAFVLEAIFYASLASERIRARFERLPPYLFATMLTIAAVLPYCLATLAFGTFQWRALASIAGLAGAVSFWYILLPKKPAEDLLLLVFMTVVWLGKLFPMWYVCPYPKLYLPVLGQLMWFRTGLFAMLSIRRVKGVGFGFWPLTREWKIGVAHFAIFLPLAAVLAWAIGFAAPRVPPLGWEKTSLLAIGTFFGILWVVALAEEFFFRGLLQQWLVAWTRSEWAGLIFASLVFGAVHVFYRLFPNWRLAALAALAGVCYGLAFRRARSIRASMVTHALVVTTWKIFFA
ncbi:MAG TPA: type II CAAX endopeptidase family protein [Bryobacteraceae bacterium]|nr:type II CAAX endopeptidase family protein [Bryobacteraceae bacterium]